MTVVRIDTGTKVWFRGLFSGQASIRGVIECMDVGNAAYGVRLENGNFAWAGADQITPREEAPGNRAAG